MTMMRRSLLKQSAALLLAFTLSLPAVPAAAAAPETPAELPEWTQYSLIAHGLGGIDNVDYTNSLEAFKTNYDKGQRLFEVDFSITEDGRLAARHDWMGYLATKLQQNIPAERLDQPLTMREFKSYKILGKYTPLSLTDVFRIMQQYPDTYFITDTKETDPELVRRQFTQIRDTAARIDPTLLDRLIPELYSPEMIDEALGIFPFKNYIFSIYMSSMTPTEVADFVKERQIKVVAMPFERATASYMRKLSDAGAIAYVHSLNDPGEVQKYWSMGVHGVYTDFLAYSDMGIDTTAWTNPAQPVAAAAANGQAATEASVQTATAVAGATTDTPNRITAPSEPITAWERLKLLIEEIFAI